MEYTSFSRALMVITALVLSISPASAQTSTSTNYTYLWTQHRAAIVRDVLYIDGGFLSIGPSVGFATEYDNTQQYIFSLNLSTQLDTTTATPFDTFSTKQKASGNQAPQYYNGFMFADDDQIYLYGGEPLLSGANDYDPPGNQLLNYQLYPNPGVTAWNGPGFFVETLGSGLNVNVTEGAGVNVPSESFGYYFSGLHGVNWGPIYNDDGTNNATIPSQSLISVDMSSVGRAVWTNTTFGTTATGQTIQPRADGQLVWIPVGPKGVLVAIGGYQVSAGAESSTFMTSLPVYDIASQLWYLQNTSGTPPGLLASFCSVVASARDGSSSNVYIYGGYDEYTSSGSSSDVWILSLPSFTWIQGPTADISQARSSHVCALPYPDQMMIVGGETNGGSVNGGIIQVLNLYTLTLQTSYNPTVWSPYRVPDAVVSVIGGNTDGGATKTAPATWANTALASVFAVQYTGTSTTYYPYSPSATSSSTPSSSSGSSSSHNKWLVPVVVVVVVMAVITVLILMYLCCWRRRRSRSSDGSTTVTGRKNTFIDRWRHTTYPKTDPSVTTDFDEASTSAPADGPSEIAGSTPRYSHSYGSPTSPRNGYRDSPRAPIPEHAVEVSDDQLYEMHVVNVGLPPVELATEYNSREQASFPRSIDYALSGRSSNPSQRAPSPYVVPQNPDMSVVSSPQSGHPSSITGTESLAGLSPRVGQHEIPRELPVAGEAARGGLDARPVMHNRNVSSVSSGVPQVPAPDSNRISPEVRPQHVRNASSVSSSVPQLPPAQATSHATDEVVNPQSGVSNNLSNPASTPAADEEEGISSTRNEERLPLVGGNRVGSAGTGVTRDRQRRSHGGFREVMDMSYEE